MVTRVRASADQLPALVDDGMQVREIWVRGVPAEWNRVTSCGTSFTRRKEKELQRSQRGWIGIAIGRVVGERALDLEKQLESQLRRYVLLVRVQRSEPKVARLGCSDYTNGIEPDWSRPAPARLSARCLEGWYPLHMRQVS